MRRCAAFLLAVASAAAAQDYERMLNDARRLLLDDTKPLAARFDAQHEALARAALAYPDRWEAFFVRGENRCNRAYHFRAEADLRLAEARATGMDDAAQEAARKEIDDRIAGWRAEAYREFSIAENLLRRHGEWRPDHELLIFANASMKYAGREYLRTASGQRGAIEDFKELVRRNFRPEQACDHIALCYLDAGHQSFLNDAYADAQRLWDEGLKWARQPLWRQLLLTNKAAVHALDHEYGLAEEVLRKLVEADPKNPVHHKNLGLVLGYQNRLKEAIYHYDKARELCRGAGGPGLALANGNAWLRPAVIHGTLLETEGDVLLAWRLFLEYRQIFGDDYNFCLWFGDFASSHGDYDLAWRYLERARDLRPRCSPAYQKLAQIAPRTKGTREEVEVRSKASAQALADAQARYFVADENPMVAKICGGVADRGDVGGAAGNAGYLDPDPLGKFDADHPPSWVEAAARSRDPFVPFEPSAAPEAPPETKAEPEPRRTPWALVVTGAILLLGGAAAVLVFRRGTP